MKIKVTKGRNSCWYNDFIGEIFEVTNDRRGYYTVKHNGTDDICVVNHEDCEVIPEFTIGSKVIVRDNSEDDGRTGVIIGTDDVYPWRIRYDSNGENELFFEGCLELVPEEQWLTKEAALCLAIKGAKVINKGTRKDTTYVYWNGRGFVVNIKDDTEYPLESPRADDTHWKIWIPPTPPKPKFSIDSFVIFEECYVRIIDSEFKHGNHRYYVSKGTFANAKSDCMVADETELTEV